jgi:hypothetical protein
MSDDGDSNDACDSDLGAFTQSSALVDENVLKDAILTGISWSSLLKGM